MHPPAASTATWSLRWPALARAAGIAPDERVLLALSGGADSVLLLHWLAAARPPVAVRAVHVDHGLRGAESAGDARFCADLARALGVPCACLRASLDPRARSLEARARAERYRLLVEEARRTGHRTIVTAHHADDALETLLLRWVRGTELSGLRGPRAELLWHDEPDPGAPGRPVRIIRPLLGLRRAEVRALLAERGLSWREDRSNADPRFTRSRVRHGFLPALERLCGEHGLEQLRELGRAVEELERALAPATAHLRWKSLPHAAACRGPEERALGGACERGALAGLALPLARRALWRLLTEATGVSPSRSALERILGDLTGGRCRRHSLPGNWTLVLRSREILLLPPRHPAPARCAAVRPGRPGEPAVRDLDLSVPGIVTLEDGRRISAELRSCPNSEPPPARGLAVELDAVGLPSRLSVRWPRPGDRFRALGSPGSRRLVRFLADRGIPREERAHVPLVLAEQEILWVAGLEPCERARVRAGTARRLRLALHGR